MAELKDAIATIMASFEQVQKNLQDAQASLAATKAENAKWDAALAEKKKDHGRLIGELEAKRTTADAAAAEAKARVDLNNQQAAELMRFKDEIKDREVKVAQRESDVGKVARALVDKENALIAREHDIDSNEKDMARRRAKLAEALG